MNNNENKDICSKCGGVCCKLMGYHLSPQDIKGEITVENILSLLSDGNHSLDCWEGDPRSAREICSSNIKELGDTYYIIMRNKNGDIIDLSWGSECIMFEEGKGCKLSWDNRPLGGKGLIPSDDICKDNLYSPEQCCLDWLPYHDILESLDRFIRTFEFNGNKIPFNYEELCKAFKVYNHEEEE